MTAQEIQQSPERKVEQGGKVYLVVRRCEMAAVRRELLTAGYRLVADLASGRYAGTDLVKRVKGVADAHDELWCDVFAK